MYILYDFKENSQFARFTQTFKLPPHFLNVTIKDVKPSSDYTMTMYSVITDVNGEEFRSKMVTVSYRKPKNSGKTCF